jgi:hypothetical protein
MNINVFVFIYRQQKDGCTVDGVELRQIPKNSNLANRVVVSVLFKRQPHVAYPVALRCFYHNRFVNDTMIE